MVNDEWRIMRKRLDSPFAIKEKVLCYIYISCDVCGMVTNRKIDSLVLNSFLSGGELHIEESFAFSALSKYMSELEMLRSNIPFEHLGMSSRRQQAAPKILNQDDVLLANADNYASAQNTPADSIAFITLKGVMQMDGGPSSYGVQDTISFLESAVSNPNISGILFSVDTGGGEAKAGNALKEAIAEATQKKPVIAWVDTMASAGVMAMLPANEIIAKNERSRVGSIGTYMSIDKSFLAWYKANITDLYAEDSVNKNLEFRQMVEGDFSGVQKMINKINKDFTNDVKTYRPLSGDVPHTLSGAMFDAKEAKSRGLIDGIGSREYAVKRLMYHQKNNY